ncbi:spore germination protein GerPE [Alkalihalobacterium chitinilyticum]|uniref:Spore germination protein GerPE n=1 Tax=Alkalihalobacterium chitinilyticum TaxID=2980103 RepID=A0ABT5VDQ3_9BACI|nr:spore germination protein GerPE [Alkalihalobacterium chitinilyticum]MDE5413586.1 spore germination protein GerPE [Alkalihalobacterium chitinilyticum]
MQNRISHVNTINVNDVSLSSTFQVGDSYHINQWSRALAVQRQIPFYFGNEGNFDVFPMFHIKNPMPVITEPINITRTNENPFIHVDHIRVIAVGSASSLHIGSNSIINAETRIKHIRQFVENP